MKIAIGVSTNRGIKAKTTLSLLNLEIPCEKIFIMAEQGYTIAENRSYIVAQALKNNCTHILFIDDDMVFPPDTLIKLLANNKEIIGVNTNSRAIPVSTTVGLMDEKGDYKNPDAYPPWQLKVPDELFECYSVGGGILLMDIKIFGRIEKPWFDFKIHESGMVLVGEDCWFCGQAKKAGFKIWCDPTIKVGHIGDYTF